MRPLKLDQIRLWKTLLSILSVSLSMLSSDHQFWTMIWTSRFVWNEMILKTQLVCYTNNSCTQDHELPTSNTSLNTLVKTRFWLSMQVMQTLWLFRCNKTLTKVKFTTWLLLFYMKWCYANVYILDLTYITNKWN